LFLRLLLSGLKGIASSAENKQEQRLHLVSSNGCWECNCLAEIAAWYAASSAKMVNDGKAAV
jgi:hypothetical protein